MEEPSVATTIAILKKGSVIKSTTLTSFQKAS